jgi:hypothetical protein
MARKGATHSTWGYPFRIRELHSEPILPTLTSLRLLYWFCLAVPQYNFAFLGGEDAILRSSAVYISAAPLSAR